MSYLSKTYHGQKSVLLFQTSLTYLCASGTANVFKVSIFGMNTVYIFQNSFEINLKCITESWYMLKSLDKGRNTEFLWANKFTAIMTFLVKMNSNSTWFQN